MELRVLRVEQAGGALQILGPPQGAAEAAGQAFMIQQHPGNVAGVAAGVTQPPLGHQPLFCLLIATHTPQQTLHTLRSGHSGAGVREFQREAPLSSCLLLVIGV